MPEFMIPGFNRRYVLVPMLLTIVLVVTAFFVTEARRSMVANTTKEILQAQESMRIVAELAYVASEAESSQRGYLLTRDEQYLEPYKMDKTKIAELLAALHTAYQRNPAEAAHVANIAALLDKKLVEMDATLALQQATGGSTEPMKLMNTGQGLRWMEQVRAEAEGIRERETERNHQRIDNWQQQHRTSGYLAGFGTLLNVLLLVVAGAYITRDIERRTAAVLELDKVVEQRTRELSELSTHLQALIEREKSKLARELHDELGGLLVAIKMDLSQVAKRLDVKQAGVHDRWQRIQQALNAGVDLKRRVIEELRPSLLDNMGLAAAVQWQATQTCTQAGISLQGEFPDAEPALDANVAIALFRVAQEALTNMAKHAQATVATVTLQYSDAALTLIIEDNGIGIAEDQSVKIGSHGLLSIRHRVQAIGGIIHIGPAQATSTRGPFAARRGTRIVVKLPMEVANAIAKLA